MSHLATKNPEARLATLKNLLRNAGESRPNHNLELIAQAYRFAKSVHKGQIRKTGEPFINHPSAVAEILVDLHQDSTTVAAGLLHDVFKSETVTLSNLRSDFGQDIAQLVDGVTKIEDMSFESPEEEQAENFRNMLLSMANDVRVILIKFADRLHNMRTLEPLRPETRRRMAMESRDIYAPLAHRLGIAKIRWELEDLSLKWLNPEAYRDIQEKITLKREEREAYIEAVRTPLRNALEEENIRPKIEGRPKNFYSIHRKMTTRGKAFDEIYDLLAIRILVDSIPECYQSLGLIHSMFTPVMSRFKDFIATPKGNMYQSLHTTVIGPGDMMLEVQIRTREMHHTAEVGIAAHWRYKEGISKSSKVDQHMTWLRGLLEWQQVASNPQEFMEELKTDLFPHEIYVLTPQGHLIQLPENATPIDFAYSVHTEVGSHCIGAKVDGKIVQLSAPLQTGNSVEILTSPHQQPHQDWLTFVKSGKARTCIRRWLREEEFAQSIRLGREIVDRELRRRRKRASEDALERVAKALRFDDVEHLHAAVGNGKISLEKFINQLFPTSRAPFPKPRTLPKSGESALRIQGLHNLMIHYAGCCNPIAGDPVIGIITRGRGVSVHRRDCPNIRSMKEDRERLIPLDWDIEQDETFMVDIVVCGSDRTNLLKDITQIFSEQGIQIRGGDLKTDQGEVRNQFQIEVKHADELASLIQDLHIVPGVTEVHRLSDMHENVE